MQYPPPLEFTVPQCEGLRWKSMFIETEGDPTDTDHGGSNYWCVFTQHCVGPDGAAVGKRVCTPSRKCYRLL